MDQQTFITTYQTFTTNAMVVRKLIQRFQVPALEEVIKSEDENKFYQRQIVRPIKLRVTKLLKLIIDTAVSEFTDETMMSLKIFIYGIADSDFAKILAKSLDKGVSSRDPKKIDFFNLFYYFYTNLPKNHLQCI